MKQYFLGKNTRKTAVFKIAALLLLASVALAQASWAQRVSATLDRGKILLGDQIGLTLKLEDVPSSYTLQNWFTVTTSPHIEIIHAGKIDTVNANGIISYTQTLTVTSFDSGKWNIPVVLPILKDKNSGQVKSLTMDSTSLEVLPVDVSKMKDYHDIKSIETVKYFDPFWIYVGIGIVALVILLILIVRWIRNRRKKSPKVSAIPKNMTPLQWAIAELDALEKSNEPTKKYYTQIDWIFRQYLEEHFHNNALQMTTEQIRQFMVTVLMDSTLQNEFFQTEKLIHVVKFAKYLPADESLKSKSIATVKQTLQFIDKKATAESQK